MKKYIRQRKKGHQFQSHFRVRIPKDLISYFQGTREFQISLKNVRNSDCLLLTITLRSRLEVLFSEVREGMKSLTIENKNIDAVRRLLRHSSVTATSSYTGVTDNSGQDLARTYSF